MTRLARETTRTAAPVAGQASRGVRGLVTGVAVAVMTGCASAPPVPQWKDPDPSAVSVAVAAPPGSGVAQPPASLDAAPISPALEPLVASDERFLAAVRGQLPASTMDLRNEEITEMGGQACASLAAGQPRRAVAEKLAGYGLPDADARRLVVLARSTLCDGQTGSASGSGNERAD